MYSVETGEEIAWLEGHAGNTWDTELIFGGRLLLSSGNDGVVNIWDQGAGVPGESVVQSDRLPTSAICAGASAPIGFVFDLAMGEQVAAGPPRSSQGIDFSPDGQFIASQEALPFASFGTIVINDAATGNQVSMVGLCEWSGDLEGEDCDLSPAEPYAAEAQDLTFSPDGHVLAMGVDAGGPGRVWDARRGEVLASNGGQAGYSDAG